MWLKTSAEKKEKPMPPKGALFTIAEIPAEQTYPLRAAVLLVGDEQACALPGDHDPTTVHFAVRDDANIVAVASICEERLKDDPAPRAWRLRGMAVAPPMRGLGFGQLLVRLSIRRARQAGAELVWCTARESARDFYRALGFVADSPPFSMPTRPDLKFYLMKHPVTR
ncbi:GNAT family N-acetyltransferase [Burkholderia ubonensis]